MDTKALLDALEKELAGYIRRGLSERAESVRAELHRLGGSAGATPPEIVPSEPVSTPTEPTRSVRKPVERVSDAKGTKTPKKAEKGKK